MRRSGSLVAAALLLFVAASGLYPVSVDASPPLSATSSTLIDDFIIVDVAASPDYATDSTVFALGRDVTGGCGPCPVLFKSTDKAVTWTRLAATDLPLYGRLTLAPGWPTDNRLYVTSGVGLHASTDGGASFRTVSVQGVTSSISPQFSAGDERILLGYPRAWVYDAALDVTLPYEKIIPSATYIHDLAFAPDHATSGKVFVGGSTTVGLPSNHMRSTVFLCGSGPVCSTQLIMANQFAQQPAFRFSEDFATNGLMYVWNVTDLYQSTDGGLTYTTLTPPGGLGDLVLDSDDDIYAVVGGATSGAIMKSSDGGATWSNISSGTTFGPRPQFIRVLPDGRLLATFDIPAFGIGGVQCSLDDGATWTNGC